MFWITGAQVLHPDVIGDPQVVVWQVDDPDFGGVSSILMDPGGTSLLAGGDRGTLMRAQVQRDSTGQITALTDAELTPVSLASGRPPTTFKMDLEALTRDPKDGLITAYEGFVRIERLAAPGARPVATHPWDMFVDLFGNQAFEALATLPDGRVIAITENPKSLGFAGSVILSGGRWRTGPDLPLADGFAITGADVGADGCLYLVERRYRLTSGFTSRLRRISGGPKAWEDTVLYQTPPAHLGNVEGVASWQDDTRHLALTLVTDNGFLPLTPTRLIELRVALDQECKLIF